MNRDRWNQVKDLFQKVLEQDADAREEFIREITDGDATLRFELQSLLNSHEASDTFLSRPPGREAAEILASDQHSLVGERLGPYRVIRRVGRGGTGAVYLAARDDDEFQRRVAIKVIRRGMATEDTLNRFRSERQILASIDHPNIARLLDGGSTDDGLPYFVMEYIEGEPLHTFCDSSRMGIEARIRLFRQICEAVRVAHQNLVVHRDLKPGNILVTAEGVPKLLDFGIAKLLNPELSSDTREPTMLELRVMTPEYASPEQMQGRTVTTASDVYSLGVMLYELLTGHRPYSVSRLSLREMEQVVCSTLPQRPSEAVMADAEDALRDGAVREVTPDSVAQARDTTPDRLRRALQGDLDNIVLKALRKEPTRRYSSAEKLADDLANHLAGKPVEARPDTVGYRFSKFVRRHRVGSAVAATALVFALLAGVTLSLQARRVARERDRAELAAAEAMAVNDFLQEILAAADPIEGLGREVSVVESVEEAVPRIAVTFVDQPLLEAAVRHTVGYTFARLGRFDEAEEQLRLALDLRRRTHGGEHAEIAETLNALGEVRYDRGDFGGAERLYDEALAMRTRVHGGDHPETAASLDNLGNVYQERGEIEAAEKAYRQALEMRRATLRPDHTDIASSLNNVATVLHDKKEFDAAEELYRESLDLTRRARGESHPEVATSLNNLAVLLHDRERYAEAEPLYRESLAIARATLGARHPDVVLNLSNLSSLLADKGEYAEAREMIQELLETSRQIWGQDDVHVGYALRQAGDLDLRSGDPDLAYSAYDRALEIFGTKLPTDAPEVVLARAGKGRCLMVMGDPEAAEPYLLSAYEDFAENYGPNDADAVRYAGWLAEIYEQLDRPSDAARLRAAANPPAANGTAEPTQPQ
jgi:serine/threonine-protein kinase